jgi:ferric-dicitrate binding protein FerR (iron transport regulator)
MNHSNEQVFQLFMEKLSGDISPEDEVVLEEMLSENPSFREIWHSMEEKAAQLNIHEFLDRVNAGAELDSLKGQISARAGQTALPSGNHASKIFSLKIFSLKRGLSVAAIFLIMIGVGYFIFFKKGVTTNKAAIAAFVQKNQQSVSLLLNNGKAVDLGATNAGRPIALGNTTLNASKGILEYTSEDTTQNTLSVPAGGNYKVVLSDGTVVSLNAATRLHFPFRFSKTRRDVYLEGEAYFKVASDSRRPFIVHTPLTQVNVLGTSFNINTYEDGKVRTALVEGKVMTQSNDGKGMTLRPGYAADYQVAKGFLSEKFDEEDELSWMNGVYYFHDMSVVTLTQIASRCYGINIVIDKEKFAGRSVTGLLNRNKLSDFLNDLETTAHIKYYYSGNNLYLE